MKYTNNVADIRKFFKKLYKEKIFSTDKTGQKTIEIIPVSFVADEEIIFGKENKKYIKAEIDWYKSMSTNIRDLPLESIPLAWSLTANKYGEVNSNYGKLIFSDKYFNQFNKVINELKENQETRRATMVYNRPSIWEEYQENGKNDFICTNAVTYYIRSNTLHCVVQMRSNDVVYGYKNDYAWQSYILKLLAGLLEIQFGNIYWQVQNLHIYERHFEYLET